MTIADLVMIGLAANRLWVIYQQAGFTYRLRQWAEREKDSSRRPVRLLAYHLWCPFCSTVSIGALTVAIYAIPGGWWILLGLAAGGAAALVNDYARMMASQGR